MSHSQFHSITAFILRHAWLNLWDKHMTTGRINQVTTVERRRWTVARGRRRRATTAFNTVWAQKTHRNSWNTLATWVHEGRENPSPSTSVFRQPNCRREVQHESPENFQRLAQPPDPLGREGRGTLHRTCSRPSGQPCPPTGTLGSTHTRKRICIGTQATGQTALRRKQARTLWEGNWRCHINGTQHYGTDSRIYRPSSPLEPRNGAQDGQPCARRSQLARKDVPTPVTDWRHPSDKYSQRPIADQGSPRRLHQGNGTAEKHQLFFSDISTDGLLSPTNINRTASRGFTFTFTSKTFPSQ